MTAIASTLVAFVWQGAFAAVLLAAANLVLRRAGHRYAAACGALAAMMAVSAATYVSLARQTPRAGTGRPDAPAASEARSTEPASAALPERLATRIPKLPRPAERTVVLCWLAGVLALTVRLLGGWAAAARLTRLGVEEAPAVWRARLESVAARLRLTRPVRLLASALVEAPAALGIFRPVILLPVSAFTALTAAELEAILAHELAHIRRHDFLVNLLQSAAETLLFYHPAVWWVSHRIRVERENACDDLAVAATGDAALYARALVSLEETRDLSPRLAVAATGGSLFERVKRLRMPPAARADRLPPSMAAVLALVAVGLLGAAARVSSHAPYGLEASWLAAAGTAAPPDVAPEAPPATAPAPAPKAKPRPVLPAPAASLAPEAAAGPKETEREKPRLSPSQLIAFRIHGVTPEFVEETRALGFPRLSADDLVAMRIHGVTPEFVRAMRAEGLDAELERFTAFRIHGVTPAFVHELRALGLERLSADQAIALRIHGVTPEFVREVRALGYSQASAVDFTAMRIHGVTPEYIRAMNRRFGEKLTVDDLVGARIHGVKGDER